MKHATAGFPGELLNQPWSARIQYFRAYTMAHPWLVTARDALVNAIHEGPPNSLILVLGPTGVGKTTLRTKIEQMLAGEMLPPIKVDAGLLPLLSTVCVPPQRVSSICQDQLRGL